MFGPGFDIQTVTLPDLLHFQSVDQEIVAFPNEGSSVNAGPEHELEKTTETVANIGPALRGPHAQQSRSYPFHRIRFRAMLGPSAVLEQSSGLGGIIERAWSRHYPPQGGS